MYRIAIGLTFDPLPDLNSVNHEEFLGEPTEVGLVRVSGLSVDAAIGVVRLDEVSELGVIVGESAVVQAAGGLATLRRDLESLSASVLLQIRIDNSREHGAC
jgi:hypothetical protein